MRRSVTILLGFVFAVGIGLGAGALGGEADSPQVGGLTPLAPQGSLDSDHDDPILFIDDEPVTPFAGSDAATLEGSGMAVPGFEGDIDDMIVEPSG